VRLAGRGALLRQDELVGPGDPEPVFLLPVDDDHTCIAEFVPTLDPIPG
jgi:hypothetical protein